MIDAFVERCRKDAWAFYMGDGRIGCRALGRYNLIVDANDIGLTPNLVCDGYWEPGISVVLENIVREGMTTVDIGANVGYFSLLMAAGVGPAGKVISIEANPAVADLLRDTIVLNGFEKRIELHNAAAAEKTGEVDFYIIPERNLNGCILLDEWREKVDPKRIRKVPTIIADDLLSGRDRVDLIKIDVEGAEHLVWAGLERTISRNADITVVMEYNFMRHSKAGDLIDQVEAQGFPLRYIDFGGEIRPVGREALFDTGSMADWMLYLNRREELPQ